MVETDATGQGCTKGGVSRALAPLTLAHAILIINEPVLCSVMLDKRHRLLAVEAAAMYSMRKTVGQI